MDVRGQGALEYLLLIGGAVLVAAIVIALMTSIPSTGPNPQAQTFCASKLTFTECTAIVGCGTSGNAFSANDGSKWECAAYDNTGSNTGVTIDTFFRCGTGAQCP